MLSIIHAIMVVSFLQLVWMLHMFVKIIRCYCQNGRYCGCFVLCTFSNWCSQYRSQQQSQNRKRKHEVTFSIQQQMNVFKYQCLPYSFCITKLLEPVHVMSLLRSRGLRVVVYFDNLQILHQNVAELRRQFDLVINLFREAFYSMRPLKFNL